MRAYAIAFTCGVAGGVACLLCLLLLVGCPPSPVPPPVPPDATDSAVPVDAPVTIVDSPSPVVDAPLPPADASNKCAAACAAMKAAGCTEGAALSCIGRMQTISDKRLNPNPSKHNLPVTCDDLASVKTPADVRANGEPCTLDGG